MSRSMGEFHEKRGEPIKMDTVAAEAFEAEERKKHECPHCGETAGYRRAWGVSPEGRSMLFVGLCPKCHKEGPLMFDVHQLRDELTGRWENPDRIRRAVCSPRYLKVVCDCDKGIDG